MASHHRAAVVTRSGTGSKFDIKNLPIPKPQPWEILVKLSATGVCGTDMALAGGYLGPCRDILGHEGVGRVVQIGSGVDPSTIKVGDRVGIAWVRDACGQCSCCREPGGEVRCLEQQNSGRKWDGTFAEHCLVPSRYVLTLPDDPNLPDELVAPILCGGVTAYKALKACEATPGDWVAIVGAGGGVGGLGIQYAKAMGYRVAAVDVGPTEDFCMKMGADAYFDGSSPDTPAKLKKLTPDDAGAKAVIVTAGSGKAYQNAIDLVAVFGTLVCVGIPSPDQAMSLHPLTLIDRGIKLLGTMVGTRTETLEALEFVRRGVVKPIVQTVGFDQIEDLAARFSTDIHNSTGQWLDASP
ncbi:hypothetical protein FAUST_1496 [Fusarium austroamericanum]|uniref:Enoyl reductase (ER) domain-containing protein n=1 Tax=Fusarium austroamericanum TaxID=282268 RepID=A0AAN6C8E1_FUSAU|nr:hypothetical protein FAUST_1496 [Fusarium austroamericanum]